MTDPSFLRAKHDPRRRSRRRRSGAVRDRQGQASPPARRPAACRRSAPNAPTNRPSPTECRSPTSSARPSRASTTGSCLPSPSTWRSRSPSGSRSRLVYASLTDFVQHSAAPGEPRPTLLRRGPRVARPGARRRVRRRAGGRPRNAREGHPRRQPQRPLPRRRPRHRRHPPAPAPVPDHRPLRRPPCRARLAGRVHLHDLDPRDRARGVLAALPGVEGVLDRFAAAGGVRPARPIGSAT